MTRDARGPEGRMRTPTRTSARTPAWLRPHALVAWLGLALAAASCGEASFAHVVRLTMNDPTGRLGPAAWKIALLQTTNAYDGGIDYALRAGGGEASPASAFVGHIVTSEARMMTDTAAPRVLHVALVIPALNAAGWFRTQLVVLPDGTCRGYARFAPWGELAPPIAGEVLLMHGVARPNTGSPGKTGWSLDLTIDIPRAAAPETPDATQQRP